MFEAAFECFPWDLDLEGYDDVLARLAGDIGVDAVRVAATHEGMNELRPRAPETARVFMCGAAAHFQPDARRYVDTRIRPIPAAWMKSRNPLKKTAEAARKHGLTLRASVACCQGVVLAERYPHAACVDFFGRPSGHWLCPSHPDVRAYLGALVEDLTTNYPLAAIELEAADFGAESQPDGYAHPFDPPGDPRMTIFSWCSCAACGQRAADAGADVPALRMAINNLFEKWARLEPIAETSLDELIAADRNIALYQRSRIETVTSLVRLMQSRSKAPLRVALLEPTEATAALPSEIAKHCDGFLIPIGDTRDDRWPADIIASAGGPTRCGVSYYCYPPWTENGPTLVTAVHRASQAHHPSITFHNYGMSPEPCLDWVRQAIRYARREAS